VETLPVLNTVSINFGIFFVLMNQVWFLVPFYSKRRKWKEWKSCCIMLT